MYHFLTKKYDFASSAKLFYDTNTIIFCRQEVVFHGYLRVTRFCRKDASSNISTNIVPTLFICLLSSVCKAAPAVSSADPKLHTHPLSLYFYIDDSE